jgi:hypothetical protein
MRGKAHEQSGGGAAALVAACWIAAFADAASGLSGDVGPALGLANGFLATILIQFRGTLRLGAAALCLIGVAAALAFAGAEPMGVALGAASSLLEAGIAGLLASRIWWGRRRRLALVELILLLPAAVAPAALLGGAATAAAEGFLKGANWFGAWPHCAIRDGLGLAVVLPFLTAAMRQQRRSGFDRPLVQVVGLLASLGALTALVFLASGFSLFFVVFPVVSLIAVRLGPDGAIFASGLVSAIAIGLTLLGHGPVREGGEDLGERLRLAQVFSVAIFYTAASVAGAQAHQVRLWRLFTNRDRNARAALARARAAERLDATRKRASGPAVPTTTH